MVNIAMSIDGGVWKWLLYFIQLTVLPFEELIHTFVKLLYDQDFRLERVFIEQSERYGGSPLCQAYLIQNLNRLVAEVRHLRRVLKAELCSPRVSMRRHKQRKRMRRLFCERRRKTKLKINYWNTRVGCVSTDNDRCACVLSCHLVNGGKVRTSVEPWIRWWWCRWHEEIALWNSDFE